MSIKICKYQDRCIKRNCPFLHECPQSSFEVRPKLCRYGEHCRAKNCTYMHKTSLGGAVGTDTSHMAWKQSKNLFSADSIATIEDLLSSANEQLEKFDHDCKRYDETDGEDVLNVLQQNALNELQSQRNEFDSAINCLSGEYHSIASSTARGWYEAKQLQLIQQRLRREIKRSKSRLPIYARRSDIVGKIMKNQVLILKADTGSGKSTQVVQYLADENFANYKQIICTQPRKLAARSLAARVAEEYGCNVGEEIGFQVGGSRSTISNTTQIKFVTDTLFLNEYLNDPTLENYSVVIVDEAHERKIDTDIVFGIMTRCLRDRKDLKLVIMSATLDMELLFNYFAPHFQCDTLEISGRTYPIEDTYLDEDPENYVQASVTKAIEIHQSGESGDILVFLTGPDEIDVALSDLNQALQNDNSYIGLPLHGKLSEEENSRIFEKMPYQRKIIFSTNVAETSVTIDGIKHVVDSGMVKEKMWDEKRKMQVLKIGPITKSSVKQRRGRGGRTSAGKCYHLYTIETYEAMDTCSRAEILCTQPTIAILKLKHLNIDNIESFEWLEPPSASTVAEAYQILIWLNAIDSQGKLTQLGRSMARLDIDPKLTVMLYKAQELRCLSYALILAGMLTISQNVWWNSKDQQSRNMAAQIRAEFSHESGDHITFVNLYLQWSKFCAIHKNKKQQYEWCKTNSINAKSLQMASDFIKEKARQMNHKLELNFEKDSLDGDVIFHLLQCMTAGHFFNLAISNGPLRAGYQVISPFSAATAQPLIARVFRTSTLCFNETMPKFILFNELLNLNETNYITTLSAIDLDWLKSVSQIWYHNVNVTNLHTMVYVNYAFENVGPALLRAVVGKRNCNLNRLEELIEAIVEVDYKQSKLIIWSQQAKLERAKHIVEEIFQKETQKLLEETEEIRVVRSTRILMGAGGVSQTVLTGDDFIRIIITKLPQSITEERIRELCEPFGRIRKIDFLRQNASGSCVAVQYSTIEEARMASNMLNKVMEQGHEITVSGSYLKIEATLGESNYRLKAIWYLTPSTGNAKIVFREEKNALDAYQIFQRLFYRCHYERATNLPTLKVIYYLGPSIGEAFLNFQSLNDATAAVLRMNFVHNVSIACTRRSRGNSVLLQNIANDLDEEDVRSLFQNCSGLIDVQVTRGRRGLKYSIPFTAKDDLNRMFERYPSFQSNTVTINPTIMSGRLEAYVEFLEMTDLKQAIEDMNGREGIIGYGKVRLAERIQRTHERQKTQKENEYIVKLQKLNPSVDKYDLIKVLQRHRLYDNVKSVVVFREKLDKNQLNTNIYTNSREVQAGLISVRSMFQSEKNLFRSTPDCQILSCTYDGTVTALVLFNDPADVATAINRFDGEDIELSRDITKLNLIPSMEHEIFFNAALTNAIPDKIEQTIASIRERLKRVYIRALPSKETDRPATIKVFIKADDLQQATMAKIQFDNLLKGLEYKIDGDPEATSIIFDRVGIAELQQIQKQTGCYIWWHYSNSSIRIYGNDRASADAKELINRFLQTSLRNKKQTITLDIPPGLVRQVMKMSTIYRDTAEKDFHTEVTILTLKREIQIVGNQEDVAKCTRYIRDSWSTMSIERQASGIQTTRASIAECPICYESANYCLQACGHTYCVDCLKQALSTKFDTTLSNVTLKAKCMMPQCDMPFLLRDIKTIINPTDMPKLARASLHAYLKTDSDIVPCMGIDCNQVYRKSKHPVSYFCDSCLKMYCVKCEAEYHVGLTCEIYQSLVSSGEGAMLRNIGNLGYKPCPSCKQVVDRYEGCNAVHCKCGIHFCWLCLKTDPNDIHPHFFDPSSPCHRKIFAAD